MRMTQLTKSLRSVGECVPKASAKPDTICFSQDFILQQASTRLRITPTLPNSDKKKEERLARAFVEQKIKLDTHSDNQQNQVQLPRPSIRVE
jgi:hypothetical protein